MNEFNTLLQIASALGGQSFPSSPFVSRKPKCTTKNKSTMKRRQKNKMAKKSKQKNRRHK